jgi:hypothetical protein
MRQSLPSRLRDAPLPGLRTATRPCSPSVFVLVTALTLWGPIPAAQAQKQGSLQVSARVVSIEPVQAALRAALDPTARPESAPFVRITRSVVLAEDSSRKARKPREVVTIAFVRN